MAEVWTPPAFDDISTDEFVTAAQLNAFGNSLRFLKEVEYEQFTSDVSVTATTEGTANTIVTASSITYEAVPHLVEFFSPRMAAGGAVVLRIALFDGSTQMGLLGNIDAAQRSSGTLEHRFTPTAAAHTFSVRGYNSAAGTSTINAGTGGTGVTYLPGFIRITRVPT